MDFDINKIDDENLKKQLSAMKASRLRDYYYSFLIYNKEVMCAYARKDMFTVENLMRTPIEELCKALFHDVRPDADDYYYEKGKDGRGGSSFKLYNTQLFFADKDANTFGLVDSNNSLPKNSYKPQGLIRQIASGIGQQIGYGPRDQRYKTLENIQNYLYKPLSDVLHGAVGEDKSCFTDYTIFNTYKSYVSQILDLFKDNLSLKIDKSILEIPDKDVISLSESEHCMRVQQLKASLLERLDGIVNSDFRSPLVLIVPENLDASLARGLCRIPWNLILSFDANGDSADHIFKIFAKEWEGIRPYNYNDVTSDGKGETSLFYANGEKADEKVSLPKEFKNEKRDKHIEAILNKIRKGDSAVSAIFITDQNDNLLYNKCGLECLEKNDTLLIIGTIGENLLNYVQKELKTDYYLEDDQYALSPLEIAPVFDKVECDTKSVNSDVMFGLTQEDYARYAEVGIKIIEPIQDGTPKEINPVSEFYYGKTITEKDLYNDFDVKRDVYQNFLNIIEKRLTSGKRFTYYISQTPSCGATTLVMRLGYDIVTKCQQGFYGKVILPIYINELKPNVRALFKHVTELSRKMPPKNAILAIVDRSISTSNFEELKQRFDETSCNISYVRVSEKEKGRRDDTMRLNDKLSKSELADFIQCYQRQNRTNVFEDAKYVIDFPLLLKEKVEKNIDIKSYVDSVIQSVSEDNQDLIRQSLSLIGFGSQYIVNTGNYVDLCFLDKLEYLHGKSFYKWYKDTLEHKECTQIERLIKFEKDEKGQIQPRIKTRFSKFNKFLIECNGESLTEITKRFIDRFFQLENRNDLIENYIYQLFFKKDPYEEDYTLMKEEDKFLKRLSPVFRDINDPDSIKTVFDELENFIDSDSRYLLARAQFLFNRAYFIDKETYDSPRYKEARDILEKLQIDADSQKDEKLKQPIYQSLGLLYFRLLGAVRRLPTINEGEHAKAQFFVEASISNCNDALSIAPQDTYTLVTKAHAIKSYLAISQSFLCFKNSDWAFCEEKDYIGYTQEFEETVEQISRFVFNVKPNNRTDSQFELHEIYSKLHEFTLWNLKGCSKDKIYDFYKAKIEQNKGDKKLRVLYANRLFNSLVSGPIDGIREKLNDFKNDQIRFIQDELKETIKDDNFGAYEKVFLLHLNNNNKEIYEISKELDWLKNWLNKDKENPLSQLWGNYFIAMLYYAKVLLNGEDIEGATKSADEYTKSSKVWAEGIKRNDTKEFYYFRKDKEELGCITERSGNASFMEGYVFEVGDRQGKVKLDCGLTATFAPGNEFFSEDGKKRTKVRAKVGFRFSGLGLYGVERVNEEDNESDIDEVEQNHSDITNNDSLDGTHKSEDNSSSTKNEIEGEDTKPLEKDVVSTTTVEKDNKKEDSIKDEAKVTSPVGHKVLGKMDLSQFSKQKKKIGQPSDGDELEGEIVLDTNDNPTYVRVGRFTYKIKNYESGFNAKYPDFFPYTDKKYQMVKFVVKVEPKHNAENSNFFLATKVRPIIDDDEK